MISQKKYYKIPKIHAFESLTVSSKRQQWRVKKIIMIYNQLNHKQQNKNLICQSGYTISRNR